MKIEERVVQNPGLKKMTIVDANNVPLGESTLVNITDAEEPTKIGTLIDAKLFEKINGREDDSVSFKAMDGTEMPVSTSKTQIVTDSNGNTWLIPPAGSGRNVNLNCPYTITELYSGSADSGTITLKSSRKWSDFDELEVWGSFGGNSIVDSRRLNVKNWRSAGTAAGYYGIEVQCAGTSTYRRAAIIPQGTGENQFKVVAENGTLRKIYGIKYSQTIPAVTI